MSRIAKWPRQVTFRRARPSDAEGLVALAQLDGIAPLRGDVLLAEVVREGGRHDGRVELWAAAEVAGRPRVAADPFRPSGELALVLAERAAAIARAERADAPSTRRSVAGVVAGLLAPARALGRTR